MSSNCYIGRNETRYSSDDLQAVLDEVVACLERAPRAARQGSYNNPVQTSVGVGYWSGKGRGYGKAYSEVCADPVLSKSHRLLIRPPAVVHDMLSPTEQLAAVAEFLVPAEALLDIAGALAVQAGYKVQTKGRSWYRTDVRAIRDILESWTPLRELSLRVMKNVQDRKAERDPSMHLRDLKETFHNGGKARVRQHHEREAKGAIRTYFYAWCENEGQRQRLIKKGGHAEPAKTVVELCEELLAEAKRLEKTT